MTYLIRKYGWALISVFPFLSEENSRGILSLRRSVALPKWLGLLYRITWIWFQACSSWGLLWPESFLGRSARQLRWLLCLIIYWALCNTWCNYQWSFLIEIIWIVLEVPASSYYGLNGIQSNLTIWLWGESCKNLSLLVSSACRIF